jgi:hypothetical protein
MGLEEDERKEKLAKEIIDLIIDEREEKLVKEIIDLIIDELDVDLEEGLKISLDAIACVIVLLSHRFEIGNKDIFLKYIYHMAMRNGTAMTSLPDLEGEDMRKWLQARHNKNT